MTIPELPIDLVEEILCFVPATSLKRLRLNCKRWNRLINDDKILASKNFDKAAKQFEILMLTEDYRICPLRVNPHGSVEVKSELRLVDPHSKYSAEFDVEGVIHCDGLLLCTHEEEYRIVVWNPLTGETKGINIHKRGCFYSLGYSKEDNKSCNKSYKILSCHSYSNVFEIYEFKYNSWRVLNDINAQGGWELRDTLISVSLKGNIYMFADDKTETPSSLSLLKFDFSTEKFLLVPLPYKGDFKAASICSVREEKLSVLLRLHENCKTEIWVTNKIDETTTVLSWSKVLALDLSVDHQISNYGSFLLDEEKKVVMCCNRWIDEIGEVDVVFDNYKCKDVVYIVGEDNKATIVDCRLDTSNQCWSTILDYVPSLVQIEQPSGKRKRALQSTGNLETFVDLTKKLGSIRAEMKILDPMKTEIRYMSLLKKAKQNLLDRLLELVDYI
ncbi:F-box protein ETP2 [Cardamine amara subsp. amara]|uniref:F-box protein ETP2 n=1 Tax=Cardamine amara subsp. amara TaxID=228776 RepID=A0ABD1BLI5_CARAN